MEFDTPKRDCFLKHTATKKTVILGRGTYGIVFKAIYKKSNAAVKIVSKCDNFKYSSISRERNILGLNHENIIKILKIVETKDYGAIIMERFDRGKNLQFILNHCVKIDLIHCLKILKDIANALMFCHENSVIHRDLKPDNCLIIFNGHEYICKIFDFGCSYKFNNIENAGDDSSIVGTVRYAAPELLQGESPTPSIDVYSFGIMMWQLKENQIPYEGIKSNEVIIWQVVKNNLRPDQDFRKNNSIKILKSNLLSLEVPNIDIKSFTPTKLLPLSNRKSSKSDFKHDKFISKCAAKGTQIISRKSLFSTKFLDSLNDAETGNESTDEFIDFLTDHQLYLRKSENLLKAESEYVKMYKSCWNENPKLRPNVEKICNLVEKIINYLSTSS